MPRVGLGALRQRRSLRRWARRLHRTMRVYEHSQLRGAACRLTNEKYMDNARQRARPRPDAKRQPATTRRDDSLRLSETDRGATHGGGSQYRLFTQKSTRASSTGVFRSCCPPACDRMREGKALTDTIDNDVMSGVVVRRGAVWQRAAEGIDGLLTCGRPQRGPAPLIRGIGVHCGSPTTFAPRGILTGRSSERRRPSPRPRQRSRPDQRPEQPRQRHRGRPR